MNTPRTTRPDIKESDPITAWYIPRNLSRNLMLEERVREYEDVPLPLRYVRPVEAPDPSPVILHHEGAKPAIMPDAVHVLFKDAIKAYKLFGREAVAAMFTEMRDQTTHTDTLIFGGPTAPEVIPAELMQRLMPGIEDFDSIEI